MKAKKNKAMMIIALLLIAIVLFTGCAAQEPAIKSQEEVQQVVSNVTENIGDIRDTLEEIDQTFG